MAVVLGDLLDHAAKLNPAGGVVAADSTVHSWAALDVAANRLASWLVRQGVGAGDRVAVLHPKSVSSFVAVHAIVRCGAIMVPFDPLGPKESVEAVLDFCEPAAIVGAAEVLAVRAPTFAASGRAHLVLSGDSSKLVGLGVDEDLIFALSDAMDTDLIDLPEVRVSDPAYIIFTSGSTGEPKGILHTHGSAMAYAQNALTAHGLTTGDRVAGTSPLHFDMSTLELYVTPLAGATAVTITEGALRFPASLSQRFEDTGITVIYAVPYQLRQLSMRGDLVNRNLSALRQISFGGEQFSPGALHELAHALPPAELINVYGPAETNGIVSHRWPPHPTNVNEVPIGTTWPEVDVRIVDESFDDVGVGDPGELLAASPSQMTGYWRRPDLNEHCFVSANDRRWYRTGDIVQSDGHGVLHFLGRADTRVKVRGVRLELETIESVLSDAPGVESAVAGVQEDAQGIQHVVAWVLALTGEELLVDEIRRWCSARLPSSAVPSEIRIVDSFASTQTGKIDRKSLREGLTD